MSATFSRFNFFRKGAWKWGGLITAVYLLFQGPVLMSKLWSNAGLLLASRVLATSDDSQPRHDIIKESHQLLNKALDLNADNLSGHRGLGWALSLESDEEQAAVEWLTGGYKAADFAARAEGLHLVVHNYEEALLLYERAISLEPGLGDLWYKTGLIYEKFEQWDKAANAYEQGLSKPLVEIGKSDIYYQLGKLYLKKFQPSDISTALYAFDEAIASNSYVDVTRMVDTHYLRGEIMLQMGLNDKALLEYEWVVDHDPTYVMAYVRMGSLVWEIEEDASTAEALFEQAIALDDQHQAAYMGMAKVYRQTGRISQAIELYRRVLILNPENIHARSQLDNLTDQLDE